MINGSFVFKSVGQQLVWQSSDPNGLPANIAVTITQSGDLGPNCTLESAGLPPIQWNDIPVGTTCSASGKSFTSLVIMAPLNFPEAESHGTYTVEVFL